MNHNYFGGQEKMAISIIIISCLFALDTVNTEDVQCFKPALFRKEPLVHLKDGSIIKSLTKEIILACESTCSLTSNCKSVNVRKREDGYYDCDLLSENTATIGSVLEPLKDSTYYEVMCFPEPLKHNPCYPCTCVGSCNVCQSVQTYRCECDTSAENPGLPDIYFSFERIKDGNKIEYERGGDTTGSKEATIQSAAGTVSIVKSPERGNVAWLKGKGASIKIGYFSAHCTTNPDNSIIKELTVVAWVKIAQQSTDAVIFVSGKGGINGFLFQRLNDVLYGVAKTRSRYVRINQNTGFQGLSGKWAHVAMTYKDSSRKLVVYANGDVVQESSHVMSRSQSENSKYVYIGHPEYIANSQTYNMMVDDYAIYCKTLSSNNIAFLYNLS